MLFCKLSQLIRWFGSNNEEKAPIQVYIHPGNNGRKWKPLFPSVELLKLRFVIGREVWTFRPGCAKNVLLDTHGRAASSRPRLPTAIFECNFVFGSQLAYISTDTCIFWWMSCMYSHSQVASHLPTINLVWSLYFFICDFDKNSR